MESLPWETDETIKTKRIYKPKDPEYFKKYYHEKVRIVFNCPHCTVEVKGNKGKLAKHMQTQTCQRMQQVIRNFSQLSLSEIWIVFLIVFF